MSFPDNVDTFTLLTDLIDDAVVANINPVYTAIEAIETYIIDSGATTSSAPAIHGASRHTGNIGTESQIIFDNSTGHDHDGTDSKYVSELSDGIMRVVVSGGTQFIIGNENDIVNWEIIFRNNDLSILGGTDAYLRNTNYQAGLGASARLFLETNAHFVAPQIGVKNQSDAPYSIQGFVDYETIEDEGYGATHVLGVMGKATFYTPYFDFGTLTDRDLKYTFKTLTYPCDMVYSGSLGSSAFLEIHRPVKIDQLTIDTITTNSVPISGISLVNLTDGSDADSLHNHSGIKTAFIRHTVTADDVSNNSFSEAWDIAAVADVVGLSAVCYRPSLTAVFNLDQLVCVDGSVQYSGVDIVFYAYNISLVENDIITLKVEYEV